MNVRWLPPEEVNHVAVGVHYDAADEVLRHVYVEDVETVVKCNRDAYKYGRLEPGDEWRMFARIPAIFATKWKNELGIDIFKDEDFEKICELLHDPDYSDFRTLAGTFIERTPRQYYAASTARADDAVSRIGKGGRAARAERARAASKLAEI